MTEVAWPDSKAMPASIDRPTNGSVTLESLAEAYADFIWRVLRRLGLSHADADDGVQKVFMVAANKMDQLDETNARSFLYGTAVRIASNMRRGFRRQRALLEAQALESSVLVPGPDKALELRQACELLDVFLARLPDEQRRVLVLIEIEQCSLAEVAELEGLAVGTVSSRLRLARERIATWLQHSEPDQSALVAPNPNPSRGKHD